MFRAPVFAIVIVAFSLITGCTKPESKIHEAMRSFLLEGKVQHTAGLVKALRQSKELDGCEALETELLVLQMFQTVTSEAPAPLIADQKTRISNAATACTHPGADDSIWLYLSLGTLAEYEKLPEVLRRAGAHPLRTFKAPFPEPAELAAILAELRKQSPEPRDAIARVALGLYLQTFPKTEDLLQQAGATRAGSPWGGGVLQIAVYINKANHEKYANFAKAEENLKQLSVLLERLGPVFVARQMDAAQRYGKLLMESGSYREATEVCRSMREKAPGRREEHERVLKILYDLDEKPGRKPLDVSKGFRLNWLQLAGVETDSLLQADRVSEAIRYGTELVRVARAWKADEVVDESSNRLALFLQEAGRFDESEKTYAKSLLELVGEARAMKKAIPEDLNRELGASALAIHNLALLRILQGRFNEGEDILRLVEQIDAEKLSGPSLVKALSAKQDANLTHVQLCYDAPGRCRTVAPFLRQYSQTEGKALAAKLDLASPRRRYGMIRSLQNRPYLARAAADFYPDDEGLAYADILLLKGRLLDLQRKDLGAYRNRPDRERSQLESEFDRVGGKAIPPAAEWTSERVESELSRIESEWKRTAAAGARVLLLDFSFRKTYDPKLPFTQRLEAGLYEVFVLEAGGKPRRFVLGSAKRCKERACAPEIEAAAGELRNQFSSPESSAGSGAQEALRAMSELLLPPALQRILSGLPQDSLLIVSADKGLHGVPFGALRQERGEPLIQKFAITNVTSARELAEFVPRANPLGAPVLISRAASDPSEKLAAVIPTQASVDIFKQYHGVFLEGAAVTKQKVMETLRSPFLLTMELHGFSFESNANLWKGYDLPAEAVLAIATAEMALQGYSGKNDAGGARALRGFEIARLNLEGTQLAILASCSSTWGTEVPGEGPMALSRAFRLAGAQSVTGSLWKTDLNSTLRLIDLVLASSLGIGESKKTAAALAFAKAVRSVRESGRTAAPYYWTPHVFIGNPLELNAGSQR